MADGPIALLILDGWGLRDACDNNAVRLAQTPVMDRLFAEWPHSHLSASGLDVGLPAGQMGNSEVGHLNIGAGRIIYQDFTRISVAIEDGSFFDNATLQSTCRKLVEQKGKLHLLGLLSDGGVHSHNSHLYALIRIAKNYGVKDVCIHAFMDGRDTPPQSGADYLAELEDQLKQIGLGRIVSITGRFYAMDRDNRWDRVEKAYRALTEAEGHQADSAAAAIAHAYDNGQTDEFVEPTLLGSDGTIDDGDGVIFFNFRSDRAREITRALTASEFEGFTRRKIPHLAEFVCMTEYDETFGLPVAFPSESYPDILGQVVSEAGLHQLRIAETEKYAHVTFFFNGGIEEPYVGEDRVLIPSPQDVATYDLKPEMSAAGVADEVIKRIHSANYQVIILNFANCDMVGHTGVLSAAVTAVETVDYHVGRVVDAVTAAGGKLLITADHGNCEKMVDDNGQPHTAHTSDPVPLILIDPANKQVTLDDGILADLAPTMLDLLGIKQPSAMTGHSLLQP
jgi:2,3-bisphosphoglycerate-independent phosphoglycerate mutase